MSDENALRLLRRRVLDESESLGGLLRACLMLGAETGSSDLKAWANRELNGYDVDDELPKYRIVEGAPLFIDSISGNNWMRGQQISHLQLPKFAQGKLPEDLQFRQPIEELELMAGRSDSISLGIPGFAELAALWTNELGAFQSIERIYYQVMPVTVAGMVGRVRTVLVELVGDLVSNVTLDELPSTEQVDAAVHFHVEGKRNVVTFTSDSPASISGANQVSSTTSTSTGQQGDGWWTWPRRIGAAIVGVAVIGGVIVQIVKDWPF
ncbi:AbiTii domain-containing protein [Jiangella alkaliphila]|uniref:AbiTii domain-containing protein n=1 Tax=Jiangella alkaliphila TaxID=419479 RepID=A0A1H2IUX8_9ACTN|nr:hypothetical protein [Jiangella alkaliphila]SDU47628.1 hypothetical protein SAMN04488563_2012 [Jiangella alkaliphila]